MAKEIREIDKLRDYVDHRIEMEPHRGLAGGHACGWYLDLKKYPDIIELCKAIDRISPESDLARDFQNAPAMIVIRGLITRRSMALQVMPRAVLELAVKVTSLSKKSFAPDLKKLFETEFPPDTPAPKPKREMR